MGNDSTNCGLRFNDKILLRAVNPRVGPHRELHDLKYRYIRKSENRTTSHIR